MAVYYVCQPRNTIHSNFIKVLILFNCLGNGGYNFMTILNTADFAWYFLMQKKKKNLLSRTKWFYNNFMFD